MVGGEQLCYQASTPIGVGILFCIKNYSEEDFEDMDARSSEVLRLAQKIAMKVSDLNEVLALLQLTEVGTTFSTRYL